MLKTLADRFSFNFYLRKKKINISPITSFILERCNIFADYLKKYIYPILLQRKTTFLEIVIILWFLVILEKKSSMTVKCTTQETTTLSTIMASQ